jgi:hypothetical protein
VVLMDVDQVGMRNAHVFMIETSTMTSLWGMFSSGGCFKSTR